MPFFLAALSSITFGVADFAGGMATRRAPSLTVTTGVYTVGAVGIFFVIPFVGGSASTTDLVWGALAGFAGSLGLVIYYHALATTRMAVAAPVAAVVGSLVPVVFGVVVGERPAAMAWVGVALALPAVVLIGTGNRATRAADTPARAVGLGLGSGVLFGLFGVFLSRSAEGSGLWPLASARVSATVMMVVITIIAGRALIATGVAGRLVLLAGVLDLFANILFLTAVRLELLSLVAVIMSMYPAATVALARIVLDEQIDRIQAFGMALAVAALTLIVLA